jgi:hypothetical protein
MTDHTKKGSLRAAHHCIRSAKMQLIPVEETLAESLDPEATDLVKQLGAVQDQLDTAAAITRYISEQE